MEKSVKIATIFLFPVLIFFLFSANLFASVMHSTDYAIQSDNLTPAGQENATSTDYVFRDTLGEFSTGPSTSSSYAMRSGWQEMQETYLTVSSPGPVNMTNGIFGVSGGTATGTAPFNVITDNLAGFTMAVNALTSHAMTLNGTDSSHYFSDYTDGTPTYGWAVSNDAKFGYTVVPDITDEPSLAPNYGLVIAFRDPPPGVCGASTGTYKFNECWNGFTTLPVNIISTSGRTSNTGDTDTLSLQAKSNNTVLESGTYQATITTTVSAN